MYRFNMTFERVTDWTLDELAAHIQAGHSWTAPFTKVIPAGRRTYRNKCNVEHVQLLALDDDANGFGLWLSDELFLRHGAMLHTTSSHRPDAPRSRVVFVLSEPVTPNEAERMLRALHWIYPHVDTSASDASRVFYGALNCQTLIRGNVLPVNEMRHAVKRHEAELEAERQVRIAESNTAGAKSIKANASCANSADSYVTNAAANILDDVRSVQPGRGDSHRTLRDAAVRLASLALADWHNVNLDGWRAHLLNAAREAGYVKKYGALEAQRTIDSAENVATPADKPQLQSTPFYRIGDKVTVRLPNGRTVSGAVLHFVQADNGTRLYKVQRAYYPANWLQGGAA